MDLSNLGSHLNYNVRVILSYISILHVYMAALIVLLPCDPNPTHHHVEAEPLCSTSRQMLQMKWMQFWKSFKCAIWFKLLTPHIKRALFHHIFWAVSSCDGPGSWSSYNGQEEGVWSRTTVSLSPSKKIIKRTVRRTSSLHTPVRLETWPTTLSDTQCFKKT